MLYGLQNYISLIFSTFLVSALQSQKPKTINIIFNLFDQITYIDLDFYWSKVYRSPKLDKMAEEGICFTSGYIQVKCNCSRKLF